MNLLPRESKYERFYTAIPASTADATAVQLWIRKWFTERNITLTQHQDESIRTIWWDGKGIITSRNYQQY